MYTDIRAHAIIRTDFAARNFSMGQGGERSKTGSIVTDDNTAASENNRCQNWGLIVV